MWARGMEWINSKWKMAANTQWSRRPPCLASVRLLFHVSSMKCVWASVFHCSTTDFCPCRMYTILILMFGCDKNAHFAVTHVAVAAKLCMLNICMASTHCEWLTMTLINRPARTTCDVNHLGRTIFGYNYFECCGCRTHEPPICVEGFANFHTPMLCCRNRCHRHLFSPMPVWPHVHSHIIVTK